MISAATRFSSVTSRSSIFGIQTSSKRALSTRNLILVRHGESTWNLENKFTGWVDVPLSPKGHEEVTEAGKLIKAEGINFDIAYTSTLKRAIRTLWHILEQT